jgi:cystathionine beta-lyase
MVRVSADSLVELRKRRSAKWRTFPEDVLPLPVAEMDYPIAKPIRDVLIDMIKRSDTGYSGIAPELPQAFANYAKRNWYWTVNKEQFYLATDVGVAGVEVLRLWTEPGDKVVVNTPVYLNFFSWIKEAKCEVVDVPLTHLGNEWALDLTALEEAFAAGVKAYILCHPHNPVGHIFTMDELEKIAELAKKYNVLVISDEIHAPLIFNEAKFIPYLNVSDTARETGLCITSASKSWNLAGLKCAQIVADNAAINDRLLQLPLASPWRSSLLGVWASIAAYNQGEPWLNAVIKNIDENRHYLAKLLKKHLPKAKYAVPDATYLAWIDLSAYGQENVATLLLEKGRVALSNGTDFGGVGKDFVRFNLATSKEIIKDAVLRMASVLED